MKKYFIAGLLSLSALAHSAPSQGSWALHDHTLNEYQIIYNRYEQRPIASITKLFTAVTILREGLDLNEKVKVVGRSGGRFNRGQMISRLDLMKAMLISSDNLAAESLANSYPGGISKFLEDTNQWVHGWGMVDTTIVDSSGLLPGNVSTIDNLVFFLYKIKSIPEIRNISNERYATLETTTEGKKRKQRVIKINLKNTNSILFDFDNILISKTGTTNAAGKCVVMLVEKQNRLFAVVVLGQRSPQARAKLASDLIKVPPKSSIETADDFDPIEFKFPL